MVGELLSFERVGLTRKAPLETLRQRYAARAGLDPRRVVFLPSPSAVGLIEANVLKAEQLGPVELPITAILLKRAESDLVRWETLLCDKLIEAGIVALMPVTQSMKHMDNKEIECYLESSLHALRAWDEIRDAERNGNQISLVWAKKVAAKARLHSIGLEVPDNGRFRVWSVQDAETLAARLAVPMLRAATVRRTTKETDISVRVDLEDTAPVQISTGVEYFDHMLEQVAAHGEFSLIVDCQGDLGIDAHHTIEDVALAFGQALAAALGDRRGIGRFGFELPMDESRAGVWIDLSGRPFSKFQGSIPGERVGEFPVEMTPHVFRSIADSLQAAIHVSVEGENAHHMIEACFKAFGRALRQALKMESNAIPSTKGVL